MADYPVEFKPSVFAWRLDQLEASTKDTEMWRRDVDKERSARSVEYKELRDDMQSLKDLVTRAILAVLGLCLTIAGSAIGIVMALGH